MVLWEGRWPGRNTRFSFVSGLGDLKNYPILSGNLVGSSRRWKLLPPFGSSTVLLNSCPIVTKSSLFENLRMSASPLIFIHMTIDCISPLKIGNTRQRSFFPNCLERLGLHLSSIWVPDIVSKLVLHTSSSEFLFNRRKSERSMNVHVIRLFFSGIHMRRQNRILAYYKEGEKKIFDTNTEKDIMSKEGVGKKEWAEEIFLTLELSTVVVLYINRGLPTRWWRSLNAMQIGHLE